MMKKLFSLTLAMVTALGLMLPASAAEETTDEALARAALDLDTDAYDEFQGSWYEDGLTGAWDLYWSTELEEELSISALDDGTVISYDLGLPYTASNSGDFPVFPQGDEAAAARAAGDFLDKVLREGESVKLEEPRGMDILGGDSYRYSAADLFHHCGCGGQPGPVFPPDHSGGHLPGRRPLCRRCGAPRPGCQTPDGYPGAEAGIRAGGGRHVGRAPVSAGGYGHLLCRCRHRSAFESDGAGGPDGRLGRRRQCRQHRGCGERGQRPQPGGAQMEGVRSSAFLDQSLRAEPVYGLTEYALSSAAYRLAEQEGKEDQVLCVLSYVRPGEEDSRSRTITVDARTGAVQEVFSYAPGMEEGETPALTQAEAQVKAETFLSALCGVP